LVGFQVKVGESHVKGFHPRAIFKLPECDGAPHLIGSPSVNISEKASGVLPGNSGIDDAIQGFKDFFNSLWVHDYGVPAD